MKKTLSIFLVILLLFTNVSLTFAIHYCGGKAVKSSISFEHDELSCGMTKMDDEKCDNKSTQNLTKKRCCENKYINLAVDEDYSNLGATSPTLDFKFAATFMAVYVSNYHFEKKELNSFIAYSPPSVEQDKPVLFQIFRL